jgi:ATP-binding cassette subfamily B (MDR/TAP) protein 1
MDIPLQEIKEKEVDVLHRVYLDLPQQTAAAHVEKSSLGDWLTRESNDLDKYLILPFAIGLSLLSGVCAPILCWLLGKIFDYFVRFQQQTLGPWQLANWNTVYVVGMLIAAAVCFVSTFVALMLWERLAAKATYTHRIATSKSVSSHGAMVWSQAMHQSIPTGGSLNPVDLVQKSCDSIHHSISMDAHNFLAQIATFISGFILAVVLSWRLGLILLAIVPLMAGVIYLIGQWSTKFAQRSLQAQSKAANLAQQTLSSSSTSTGIHSWGKSTLDFIRAQFTSFLSGAQGAGERAAHTHALGLAATGFIVFAVAALGFYYAGQLVSWALNTPGNVLTVFLAMFLGCSALASTPKAWQSIDTARKYVGFEQQMTRMVPSNLDSLAPSVSLPHLAQAAATMSLGRTGIMGKSIRFEGVNDRASQLSVFSASFSTNTITALIGSQTLTGTPGVAVKLGPLVQRLRDPNTGSVFVDEVDLHMVAPGSLRDLCIVSVVDRDGTHVAGASLMDNLIMDTPASPEMARQMCALLGLDAKISNLPQAYDTPWLDTSNRVLLDRADSLRLAIAHALLQDPDVLILDQGCTTALTPREERSLLEAILPVHSPRAARTVIIVNPHRETLAVEAITNVVVVAPSGTVLSSGSRQEVLQQAPWSSLLASKTTSKTSLYQPIASDGFSMLSPMVAPNDTRVEMEHFDPTLPRYSLGDVFNLSRPERPLLILGSVAALVRGLIIPAFCACLAQLLATLSNSQPADVSNGSSFWAIALVGLGCLEALAFYLDVFCFELAAERLTMRIRKNSFDSVTQQPYSWFQDPMHSSGRVMNVLAVDAPQVRGATTSTFANLLHWIAVTLGGLIWALVVGWKLALVGMAAAIPLMLLAIWLERKWYAEAVNQEAKYVPASLEDLDGKDVSIQAIDPSTYLLSRLGLAFCACLPFLVQALMWWYGASLVASLEYSLVQFLTVWLITTFVALTIGQVSHIKEVFDSSLVSLRRVADLLAPSQTVSRVNPQATQALNGPRTQGAQLTLQNVAYAYPTKTLAPAIDGVSLHIPSGSRTLIVGTHHSGKSTLLSLIANNLSPTRGAILVDGIDVGQVEMDTLHSYIGLVSQDEVLLDNLSIEENIAFGSSTFFLYGRANF